MSRATEWGPIRTVAHLRQSLEADAADLRNLIARIERRAAGIAWLGDDLRDAELARAVRPRRRLAKVLRELHDLENDR